MRRQILRFTGAALLLMMCAATSVWAQDGRTVTGTVTTAEDGSPLPGASVVVKGTTRGTSTGTDGSYEIQVPSDDTILQFSFVGYTPQEVEVGDRSTINVALAPDSREMSEIVVVGYGQQIMRDVTGNISRVSAADIEDTPVTSVEEALQGKTAGVFITQNNGKLGQGIDVQVRGIASISAETEPLYVVDGMPITTSNQSSNGAATNPLADLNFNDIESIEILKDAAAAAIYGARASNGVVLITTKSGTPGRTRFNVDMQLSSSSPTNKVDFLNAQEYIDLFLEAAANTDRIEGTGTDTQDDMVANFDFLTQGLYSEGLWENGGGPDFDWQDEAFNQNALSTKFDLSANGGDERTQFYVSGSYLDEEGILVDNTFQRLNGRVNVQHRLSDQFQVGGRLSLSQTLNDRVSNDNAFSTPIQLVAQPPIQPIFEPEEDALEEGQYQPTDELNRQTLYFNGLLYNDNVRYDTRIFRSIGSAFVSYSPLSTLTLRGEFGVDLLDQNEDVYYNSQVARNTGAARGLGFNSWDRIINYTSSAFLTYTDAFLDDRFDVEGTFGSSYQATRDNTSFVESESFPEDTFTQIDSGALLTDGGGNLTKFRFLSYFGRTNYKFDDTYLLTLSGRVDGSSRFGENNQYGFFPSASGGVILSEFDAFSGLGPLSFLKLRGSLGVTGNAGISNFASRGLFTAGKYTEIASIEPEQLPNPDLKWERTTQYNVGLDYGFFNDRLNGSIDGYVKNTNDLLLDVQIPSTAGFVQFTDNVGSMRNVGVEFVVNGDIFQREAFTWRSSLNLSANSNEVTDLSDVVVTGGVINRAFEGEPIGVFFGLEYAGVDSENGDALYFVNETDDNGNIVDPEATTNRPNEANRVVLGSPLPDFQGGFTNEFTYRGFDARVFFQFVYGNKIYDGGGLFRSASADFLDNQTADQLDAWEEPGDETDVPEARYLLGNGTAPSSRYLYDGSYLRLKNVTIGYTLPEGFSSRIGIAKARIYFTGHNLLTFTEYPLWDPEVNADYLADDSNLALGNDFYTAPQARKLTAGLQFSF